MNEENEIKHLEASDHHNMYRGWTQIEYRNKQCNINQKTKEHRTTEEEMEKLTSS